MCIRDRNYAVCGQYPGAVARSATVTLKCACGLAAYRYLIVHFVPNATSDAAHFCELEVYIHRKFHCWHVYVAS